MGKSKTTSPAVNGAVPTRSRERDKSPAEIPFEQFRYSPKLTNYTGEPAKTPQEIKAIQELQVLFGVRPNPAVKNCVAGNIRSLGNKALNTAEIAKQCKRLMVAYNIGQRLFAKYVMNQVVKVNPLLCWFGSDQVECRLLSFLFCLASHVPAH